MAEANEFTEIINNNFDEFIEIINSNFKESNFFELDKPDEIDCLDYDCEEKASELFEISIELKLVLCGFVSGLMKYVFNSEFEKAMETILKLSNNSLKSMLFLELFMNILYNDKSLNIITQIFEYVTIYTNIDNVDYLQHFRNRIVSDTNLTGDYIHKLMPIYYKFLLGETNEAFDSLAQFEILVGNFDCALTNAKNNVTKLHAHIMLKNFNEAFELFTTILEKNIKLNREEALIISKLFNLLNFASDDQLNYLVNSCYKQSNISTILPYDWEISNIFANIVLKTFNEKHNRVSANPAHSLDNLVDFNLSRISVICIANLAFENYDIVEELLHDYRPFCKRIGRSTQYELMSSSETTVIQNMLVEKYLNTNNQTRINKLVAKSRDNRQKISTYVRLHIPPHEMLTKIKSAVAGGYFHSSEVDNALEQSQQVKKYELALELYTHYHKYNTKCGFHCHCSSTITQMIGFTHDVNFGTKLLDKILKFSSSEHLYDQINDLVRIASQFKKNPIVFDNTEINKAVTKMNKYYLLFMINVFCPSIGKLFGAHLFEKEPERLMD